MLVLIKDTQIEQIIINNVILYMFFIDNKKNLPLLRGRTKLHQFQE
jgi:hypothetical protein